MDSLLGNERELLARMIQAEAGNQGETGMRAVASVMDNRRRAQGYGGNTFTDVLLAPGQFSPANSITGYAGGEQGVDLNRLQPSETAYRVADTVMSGGYEDPTGGALNFLNPDISQPSWMSSMQNTVRIGDHLFGTAGSGEGVTGQPGGTNMQRQPQGLLGNPTISTQGQAPQQAPAQEEERAPFFQRPGVANAFDTLAMGLQGMTFNPNQALIQGAQQRIQQRRETGQMEQQRNRTADWLESQGLADLAQGVRSGALGARDALAMARGSEATSKQRDYQYLIQQGIPPEQAVERVFGGGGTTVKFAQGPQIGTIEPGYQVTEDAETGALRMEPIPGGPADQERQADVERQRKIEQQRGTKESVVSRDVDRLIGMIDKGGFFDLPEAGIVGSALGDLGINQEAVTFKNTLSGIQAQVGFDRLQQMREASKTGGALGAVSERELDLLISALGAIQQNTDPQTLKENLTFIRDTMTKIENDPTASRFYYGDGRSQGAPSAGQRDGGFSVTGVID